MKRNHQQQLFAVLSVVMCQVLSDSSSRPARKAGVAATGSVSSVPSVVVFLHWLSSFVRYLPPLLPNMEMEMIYPCIAYSTKLRP